MSYGELLGIAAELRQLNQRWGTLAPQALRETRQRMGWTQYVLACKLGLSRAVVANLETGRRPTSRRMIERLARVIEAEQRARGQR